MRDLDSAFRDSRSFLLVPFLLVAVHVLASRFLRAIHVCTVAGSVTTHVVRVFPDYARCILPLRCSQFLQAHVSMSSYYADLQERNEFVITCASWNLTTKELQGRLGQYIR